MRELVDFLGERKHQEVQAETFGHLAPKPRHVYRGHILFVHSAYGDLVPIDSEFAGLPDSPWFFDDMMNFIVEQETEAGRIYRFDGTYTKSNKGARCFRGKVREVTLT